MQAMKAATGKPVLFAISGDPVELGVAQTLNRPGRNFTGSTFLSLDVAQKRVQLLRELLPNLSFPKIPSDPDSHRKTESSHH